MGVEEELGLGYWEEFGKDWKEKIQAENLGTAEVYA